MNLESQFLSNGSDGYLAWLDWFLQVRETANLNNNNTELYPEEVSDKNLPV